MRVFRRRLTVPQAIAFSATLPAVLCAVFVADWDLHEPTLPFPDRAAMEDEVRAFRRDHDFSPPGSISVIARAIRRRVDPLAFRRVLSGIGPDAVAFWMEDAPES